MSEITDLKIENGSLRLALSLLKEEDGKLLARINKAPLAYAVVDEKGEFVAVRTHESNAKDVASFNEGDWKVKTVRLVEEKL